jgi:hypothetical protein
MQDGIFRSAIRPTATADFIKQRKLPMSERRNGMVDFVIRFTSSSLAEGSGFLHGTTASAPRLAELPDRTCEISQPTSANFSEVA